MTFQENSAEIRFSTDMIRLSTAEIKFSTEAQKSTFGQHFSLFAVNEGNVPKISIFCMNFVPPVATFSRDLSTKFGKTIFFFAYIQQRIKELFGNILHT